MGHVSLTPHTCCRRIQPHVLLPIGCGVPQGWLLMVLVSLNTMRVVQGLTHRNTLLSWVRVCVSVSVRACVGLQWWENNVVSMCGPWGEFVVALLLSHQPCGCSTWTTSVGFSLCSGSHFFNLLRVEHGMLHLAALHVAHRTPCCARCVVVSRHPQACTQLFMNWCAGSARLNWVPAAAAQLLEQLCCVVLCWPSGCVCHCTGPLLPELCSAPTAHSAPALNACSRQVLHAGLSPPSIAPGFW